MLSPISSLDRISLLVQSSINLLLGTRSVKRLKMNKRPPHHQGDCLPCQLQTHSVQVLFTAGVLPGHFTDWEDINESWASRPAGAEGTAPAAAGTGRDSPAGSVPALRRRATGRWQAGERDGQKKPKGWKVEHLVCCHPFSIRKSTSLLEAQINKGGM